MRNIARIVRIDDVGEHANAHSLDLVSIGGWQVVVKRGEYKAGDLAIFVEIDGWVPEEIAPFLTRNVAKEFNGVKGNRLRTIKLRGELSQGLILPYGILDQVTGNPFRFYEIDEDVSEILGIQKWEMPEGAQFAGQPRGNFPGWIQKTDQERIQNWSHKIKYWNDEGLEWTHQEKLEGSSMTVYVKDGVFGVCSRNIDLKEDPNNTFWKIAIEQDLQFKVSNYFNEDCAVAVQGELIGPGIQGNIYGLEKHQFQVFDIQVNGKYLDEYSVFTHCNEMGLTMVPRLRGVTFESAQDCLRIAEGKSALNPVVEREGVVFRCTTKPDLTFKAISNKYLLKQD